MAAENQAPTRKCVTSSADVALRRILDGEKGEYFNLSINRSGPSWMVSWTLGEDGDTIMVGRGDSFQAAYEAAEGHEFAGGEDAAG